MEDTAKIRLGACQVTWGGVDLGYTKGGVEVTISSSSHSIVVDQEGDIPVDKVIMSRDIEVKVSMAEITPDKMAILVGRASGAKLSVFTDVGMSLRNNSKTLRLHPVAKESSDPSEDFVIPLASVNFSGSMTYSVDAERVLDVTFQAYADDKKVLFLYGNNLAGELPFDFISNGGVVFVTSGTKLPTGLSDNGGIVMTDDTVSYPGMISNGGVLIAT